MNTRNREDGVLVVTPENAMDELTFISYAHNRRLGISPAGFERMGFANVPALERRFQLERIQQAERATRPGLQ